MTGEEEAESYDKTQRVLVVRPCQFDVYRKSCGHCLPIICLPHDEIGIGYARHWIVKIATRVGLKFIWVLDDSVAWFCEYDPKDHKVTNYTSRRRKFEDVFTRMEALVHAKQHKNEVAAISPARFRGNRELKNPFTYKPPQGAVYLNLELIKDKQINYRPELASKEDMVFGIECNKSDLTVCRWNRVQLCDINWKNKTGATAPYKTSPRNPPTNKGASTPQAKKIKIDFSGN